jgi:hypothetical protein
MTVKLPRNSNESMLINFSLLFIYNAREHIVSDNSCTNQYTLLFRICAVLSQRV